MCGQLNSRNSLSQKGMVIIKKKKKVGHSITIIVYGLTFSMHLLQLTWLFTLFCTCTIFIFAVESTKICQFMVIHVNLPLLDQVNTSMFIFYS